jgi:dipeptidyl aminopeptidase/acylaminoacyl peptidase
MRAIRKIGSMILLSMSVVSAMGQVNDDVNKKRKEAMELKERQIRERKEAAKIIPLEDFFRNAERESYQISPKGGYLAYLAPINGRMNIHVQGVGETEGKGLTDVSDRDIASFWWVNENVLVYSKDTGGDENYVLYSLVMGNQPFALTSKGVRANFVGRAENSDSEILIETNERDPAQFDLYLIGVNDGSRKLLAKNPGGYSNWIMNKEGQVVLAVKTDGVNSSLMRVVNAEFSKWETLVTTNFKESITPFFLSESGNTVYCISNSGRDKSAVVEFDLAMKKEKKVLFEHPQVDIDYLAKSKSSHSILYASYNVNKRDFHFFHEKLGGVYNKLKELLPGQVVQMVSMTNDENTIVVRTYSDISLGGYHLYKVDSNELINLCENSPWLSPKFMSKMETFEFTTKDGVELNGYITYPNGKDRKGLPLIVNPHGGPWARDEWGFNPEVQFLANRGYAVLQVNFRGSTGYGRKFWELGFKQWGLNMQSDITESVQSLINTGIVDAKRVAIYGASYGGYATLAGLAFTPELYRCGIDYVGVSNLFTFMETIPAYWTPYLEMMYEMVGHPEKDALLFEKTSPVFHSDAIQAPLFIAQGAMDPRVNVQESDQMVEAMRARGVEVEYMLEPEEGHGFANEENRFKFYRAMETFLAKHMKR